VDKFIKGFASSANFGIKLVSFGLVLRELCKALWGVQEMQHELDTFPRLLVSLSVLPRFQYSIHLITQTQLLPDVVGRYCGLTVH
jgi:hypothetical protein